MYSLSEDTKNYDSGQYLLCTWLSGSHLSDSKVWVDRYYYPDLITKAEALTSIGNLQSTYDDLIEALILSNSDLSTSIVNHSFFDKKSDLVFESNQIYQYERISQQKLPIFNSTFTYCNSYSETYPTNYHNVINKAGEFTVGFNFIGDTSTWVVKSDRNEIPSGLTITKKATSMDIEYTIYDATKKTYDPTDYAWFRYKFTTPFKLLKSNLIYISVDSKLGKGYVYLNDVIVSSFTIPVYQFFVKQLLYGDFVMITGDAKIDILDPTCPFISNTFINDYYIDSNLAFVIPLMNGTQKIDTIYITLPCGMRNSTDNIEYLQSVCGSSVFKSNNVNINVKNLGIYDESILNKLKTSIINGIASKLPSNIEIANINFENYR